MFEQMAKKPAGWLTGQGEESSVVLSTRIRLARNVADTNFPTSADDATREKVLEYFDAAFKKSEFLGRGEFCKTADVSKTDSSFLVERHLISPTMLDNLSGAGVYIGPQEQVSIMVNEEDHLRIQAITMGLEMDRTMELAAQYDNEVGRLIEYDYDSDFGFLTSCPTNVGTGLRASVLIHLPGLVLTRDIDKVIQKVTKMGLAVRGFYGEGTDVLGNLFQISNQSTLGKSETDILGDIERVTRVIISDEAGARNRLKEEALDQICDKIWRAYGILKYARVLTSEEVMNLLSAVRLGMAINVIENISIDTINEILLLSQPAHLIKYYGKELDSNQRDTLRAEMVREKLL
ncbi:MAG: protein arginine kinase [candidate division Zixibacteria bacterium]|nr:protein arginine kinase [candidate division Zixibacteria bacterium]